MAKDITVRLDEVEIRGPYESKDGNEYYRHVYTAEGVEYFQFAKEGEEPKASAGDEVRMLVESSTYNGRVSNKIVALEKTDAESKPPVAKKPQYKAKAKTTSSWKKPTSTGYDTNGARTGMIVKAAVDLAIANSSFTKKAVAADDLTQSLQLVQDLTNKAEK